jgi:hypothetical protein
VFSSDVPQWCIMAALVLRNQLRVRGCLRWLSHSLTSRRIGVADKPLRYKKATPQKLAMAIHKVLHTPAMTTQAAKAAGALREEDGVKIAVEIIENWYKAEKNT